MLKRVAEWLNFLKIIFISGKSMGEDQKIDVSIQVKFEPHFKNETLHLKRPVDEKFPISSPFGWRENPFKKGEQKFHNGIDFATPVGTPVYAMAEGFCFKSGLENEQKQTQGFGLRVWQESVIDGRTLYIWYGHLSKVEIQPVEQIKKGQLIGYSGNTGASRGPHLHVQAREKNTEKLFDMVFYA